MEGGQKDAQEDSHASVRRLPGDEAQEGADPGGEESRGGSLPGFQGKEAGPGGLCMSRRGLPEAGPEGQGAGAGFLRPHARRGI